MLIYYKLNKSIMLPIILIVELSNHDYLLLSIIY